MKRLKQACLLFLITFCFIMNTSTVMAFNSSQHDKALENTLFLMHEHDRKTGKDIDDAIMALEYASYLSIDQSKSDGQDKLEFLRNYGVKNLPSTVTEKGFQINEFGEYHRRPTHRGWESSNYYGTKDFEIWTKRRPVIENTVEKIFDFKGDERKKESFCALIYYIHILGDRVDDCRNGKYYPPAVIMELGGRKKDDNTIISQMMVNIEVLFEDQKNERAYSHIMSELTGINKKLGDIVSTERVSQLNDNSSAEFQQYKELAEKTLKMFTDQNNVKEEQFATLLKGEEFFNTVFYKHRY